MVINHLLTGMILQVGAPISPQIMGLDLLPAHQGLEAEGHNLLTRARRQAKVRSG